VTGNVPRSVLRVFVVREMAEKCFLGSVVLEARRERVLMVPVLGCVRS
jgi:hypothetical protein